MEKLDLKIDNVLLNKFYQDVTTPGGIWRSKDKNETASGAYQSAVEVALKEFLDSREKKRITK